MRRRSSFNQIFWGLAIVIVGVIFLIENLGLFGNINLWKFLPILLVILGIYQLFVNQFKAWIGPAILIILGGLLFLAATDVISWAVFGTLIWPSILILLGLSLIMRRGESMGSGYTEEERSQFNIFAGFSGQNRKVTNQQFRSGEITCMFGGVELDLRDAAIQEAPARIQSTVMFGGADIFVPSDWDVRLEMVALFGGSEDKRGKAPMPKETPDLIISGTVMFGGLSLKD